MDDRERFVTILVIIASILSLYIIFSDNKNEVILSNKEVTLEEILKDKGISDNYQVVDDNYVILDNNANNILDISNDSYVNFTDFIIDKNLFNELVKNNLLLKYPKFVVDQVDISNYKNIIYNKSYIELEFDNSKVEPKINENVNIRLICKDYKDNITIDCDDDLSDNPNIYELDSSKKTVALTFDDGPCNLTLDVIKKLNENHMSATFFELGSMMKNYPDVVREIRKNNFEIGSHGYTHKSFKVLKKDKTLNELNKTKEIYKSITNEDLILTRPPYGAINDSIKEGIDTVFVKWNIDSLDWKVKDKYIPNVISNLSDGAIILLHDIHKTTVEGLDTLLPLLYSEGYQVVGVSELAKIKGIPLEKHKIYFKFVNE